VSSLPEAAEHSIAGHVARRLPFFYGWVVVYIGFLGVFMMGAIAFWGVPVFIGPMAEDTGWTRGSIFGALTARFIVGAFGGLLLGRFADRKGGPQRLLLIGLLVDAASLIALRWVESPLQFIVLYGVIGGAGNTGMRLVQSTLVAKWFVLKRATAIGFSSLGGGLSALIMVPVTQLLISQLGWRDAWTALAVIMLTFMLPMVPLAVRAPEDIGLLPDNGDLPKPGERLRVSAASERSYSLREAMHTARFWLLLLAIVFGSYSLQTHTVIMKPYFEEIGFSSAVAASALSVYGLFSIGARFLWGFVSIRLTARPAIILQALFTALGVGLLFQISGQGSLYLMSAYSGLMLGGFPILAQLVWPEYFGRAHIGSLTGLVQFITTIVGSMGPLIAGFVYDHTGSYESSVGLLIVTWLVCAAVLFSIRPAKEPEAVTVPATSG
jgi:MFS family permease